ncbi:MAG TPA: hypothetical protein P5125_01340 [Kiritimatiellia bacterium]|jgi:hypothetical protein|nr:hypothetical protein [Kiritimatiellia bacterium]HOM59017.1 hypothetical protein [Kiritimatiellia bacterium]HPC48992.1 hypothetical protein [Kiritimatiellia bacterium]HPW76060.1 hypothetical protein [Kiritimatiellia bacterium]HRU18977.1 hypothetical protein [Kiritimatiellia bacterium]
MKLMNLMPLCGAFALCALTCSASDWLSPAAPGRAYPEDEADRQWAVLSSDLTRKARFDQFAAETVCAEALITATDRDPLDILLRRTAALLADLRRQTGVRDLTPESRELAALREQAETTNPEQVAARRAFFDRALRLRRRIAFANPLLDFREMLFIKRELRGVMEHCCDQFYGQQQRSGGGLFVLADPFGDRPALRDMLANARVTNGPLKGQPLAFGTRATQGKDGGSIVSPALDYDGKRIAFAYVEGVGSRKHIRHLDHARDGHWERGFCYHIFSAGTDGTRLTQLTDGTFNDFQPCFTPAGRIAFISERRGGYLRCGRHCPAFTLFDMAEDGSDIRCLSFHETNEWSPAFTHDGMLLWTRWDYVDRHGCVAHKPWLTTPDGRNPRPVHGNYSLRPLRPDMELDTRPIPESHLLLATAAPHHGQAFGSLVLIDPRAEDDDAMGPVRRLTPDAGFPESQKGSQTYGTPWPLSKHYALCAYTPVEALGTGQRHLFGLYLLDCFGNKELIYRDPGIACLNPIPLRASPRPPVLPEQRQRIASGERGEATVMIADVYKSQMPWPEGTVITALRVWQIFPLSVASAEVTHNIGIQIIEGHDSINLARVVLGTTPVEKDGSAHFTVPAGVELFFQALDADGCAIQSMRSATAFMPGERASCQGCHEPKGGAPEPAPKTVTLAMRRAPSALVPGPEGSNPFSFPRLVQPVLDRYCVGCHAETLRTAKPGAKMPPRLDNAITELPVKGWMNKTTRYTASYLSLAQPYGFTTYGSKGNWRSPQFYRTIPGAFGARASKLYALIRTGHHGVRLDPDARQRLIVWLDSVCQFYGVYEKEGGEAQLAGGLARPTLQ